MHQDQGLFDQTPPGARLLGRRLTAIDRNAGRIEVTYDGKAEFANRHGNLQGGFLAAMLDGVVGLAVLALLPQSESAVTLDLNVSYLNPAKSGTILGRGAITHRSRSIARATGELRADTGELLANATATFKIVRTNTAAAAA